MVRLLAARFKPGIVDPCQGWRFHPPSNTPIRLQRVVLRPALGTNCSDRFSAAQGEIFSFRPRFLIDFRFRRLPQAFCGEQALTLLFLCLKIWLLLAEIGGTERKEAEFCGNIAICCF